MLLTLKVVESAIKNNDLTTFTNLLFMHAFLNNFTFLFENVIL